MMNVTEMEFVWDNHLTTLRELFNTLYVDSVLVDVTLSCQGGFLRAHKLVLSACSPYFQQVFQENPCKHPTIVLRSVRREDMSKLLEYMYKGCMNVTTSHLESIVQVANDLKIKGFEAYRKPKTSEVPVVVECPVNVEAVKDVPPVRDTRFKGQKRVIVDYVKEAKEEKKVATFANVIQSPVRPEIKETTVQTSPDPEITPAPENEMMSTSENEEEEEIEEKTVLKEQQQEMVSKIVTLFECDVCSRRFKSRKDLQKHKKIHQDKTFSCEFCNKLFSRASHLIRHRRVHTGERPFICDTCGKDFARQDKLKLHMRTSHNNNDDHKDSINANEVNIGMVENKDLMMDDDNDSEAEPVDHITLENLVPNSNSSNCSNSSSKKEKRGRGRPRKYPHGPPRRGRGRPRKDDCLKRDGYGDNYDITSLPYGDISYLTMPLEPLVEIQTDTTLESPNGKVFENGATLESPQSEEEDDSKTDQEEEDDPKTIGKIGECTISLN